MFVRGQGSWLWDSDGRAFLDFTQGLAVNCLGHSPSVLVRPWPGRRGNWSAPAPACSTGRCWHWRSACAWRPAATRPTSSPAAPRPTKRPSPWRASGAACIAAARNGSSAPSTASMDAPGHPDGLWQAGAAWPGGIRQGAVQRPRRHGRGHRRKTVAVMLEPVRGDAGVIPATLDLRGIERLCRQRGVLLISTRCRPASAAAALLAEELYGVRADIVTLGKGLGAGVPLSALLARGNACCFEPGRPAWHPPRQRVDDRCRAGGTEYRAGAGFPGAGARAGTHLRDGLARVARRYGHGPLRGQDCSGGCR